jgi:two-component system OmpR family response regulator
VPSNILIVEDDENVSYVINTALRLSGFSTTETPSGRQALEHAASERTADLVILDLQLPDLHGFEVCRRLRSAGLTTPVIFLTASDAVEDRLRGLTIGGDDYLSKPFSVEELVARVQVILHRVGKGADPRILTCGDLELDDTAHKVTLRGAHVELSPTEYKLLRFFLRNAGQALSRGQILDHVWNYDFDGESSVVETYISMLRKKIDSSPPRLIRTIRGVGYRLDNP